MRIKVGVSEISISRDIITSGEYNIHDVDFEFSKEYENLVKIAVFSSKDKVYKVNIINNKVVIPWEVLTESGDITLGVYGFGEVNNELILRYSPVPITITVEKGSYIENGDNVVPLTPTDKEQIQIELNNIDIKTWKVGNKTYIRMTNPNGQTTESVLIDGVDGKDYVITAKDYQNIANIVADMIDLTDYVKNTDYPTSSKAGVIKTYSNYGTAISTSNAGGLYPMTRTAEEYERSGNALFIGKGTLENVIKGKGLVSNTDYASTTSAGVVKMSNNNAIRMGATSHVLEAMTKTYNEYNNMSNVGFIGKGTLENVLAEYYKKQVVLTQAQYDQLTPDVNTLYFITD